MLYYTRLQYTILFFNSLRTGGLGAVPKELQRCGALSPDSAAGLDVAAEEVPLAARGHARALGKPQRLQVYIYIYT